MKNITLLFSWLCMLFCATTSTAYMTTPSAQFENEMDPSVHQAFKLIALFKKKTAHLRKRKAPSLSPEVLRLRNLYLKPMILSVLAASQATSAAQHLADCKELKRSVKAYMSEFKRVGPIIDEDTMAEVQPEIVFHQMEVETDLADADDTALPPTEILLPQPDDNEIVDDELMDAEPFRDAEVDDEFDINDDMNKIEPLPIGNTPKTISAEIVPEEEVIDQLALNPMDPMNDMPPEEREMLNIEEPAAPKKRAAVTPPSPKQAAPVDKPAKKQRSKVLRGAPKAVTSSVKPKKAPLVKPNSVKAAPLVVDTTPSVAMKPAEPTPADDAELELDDAINMEDPLSDMPALPSPDDLF